MASVPSAPPLLAALDLSVSLTSTTYEKIRVTDNFTFFVLAKKRWIWTWSPEQEDTVADVTERSGVTPDGYRTVGSSALGCTRPVSKYLPDICSHGHDMCKIMTNTTNLHLQTL
jgi:hypothetical protein